MEEEVEQQEESQEDIENGSKENLEEDINKKPQELTEEDIIKEVLQEEQDKKEDKIIVSRAYRDNKFDTRGNSILYETEAIVILNNFIKSYRYLYNLFNSLEENDSNYEEIGYYLRDLSKLYIKLLNLLNNYNLCNYYGKHRLIRIISSEIELNQDKINELHDFVLPLGKVIKLYDVDENIGVY